MVKTLTFIHIADLHQGIDFSENKWRAGIKQRSDDFLDNFNVIIDRALQKDIDFVIVAGDIFDRSNPKPSIRQIIIDKLIKLSLRKPIFIIPGNHDKSRFKMGLLFLYPNLIIFNRPQTHHTTIKNIPIAITGIPFTKEKKLETIERVIKKTNSKKTKFNILILHELIESCKVGIKNFEFTKYMKGVVPIDLLDEQFDYIALGHVHKYQKIEHSKTPMYYSGSIERTSVVEREEVKGYIIVKANLYDTDELQDLNINFIPLIARDLIYYKISSINNSNVELLAKELQEKLLDRLKLPRVLISITNLDNYEKYRLLKNLLKQLKSANALFDYNITSPDFSNKIRHITTENLIV